MGKSGNKGSQPNKFNPEDLNNYFSSVSTDSNYVQPSKKLTVNNKLKFFTEFSIFKKFDNLKVTSPGLDGIPSWFLRVAAPSISFPLTVLYNESIARSFVPKQWKIAVVTPVPKVPKPNTCQEFRPISVTPIISRVLEKLVVCQYLYLVLYHNKYKHNYMDQFAFRPSGSTTSALICLTEKICKLLVNHPYIHVISFDMSKAFDTVRHSALMEKLANMSIPDPVYNWLVDFLENRQHVTKVNQLVSGPAIINASIVQGSGIGPCCYILNSGDLHPKIENNDYNKYADDVYLLVPSSNSHLIPVEIKHMQEWANDNNLKLNASKTKEMIVARPRFKKSPNYVAPPAIPGIERVGTMKILGVLVDDALTFKSHIEKLLTTSASTQYGLKILRSKGLVGPQLWEVTKQVLNSRLLYACPAWSGFIDASSRSRLISLTRRLVKLNFLPHDHGTFDDLCRACETHLFDVIQYNCDHVLHHMLPPIKNEHYNLRPRTHNRTLPCIKTTLQHKTFLNRMLFTNVY
ncbi:MAG: reverse transcriptase family protein [Oscillospiraceae bacterium]